eukprot:5153804-Ditylum_brightwellii.AAC.1
MADNTTTSAFDGKNSMYKAFKKSNHGAGIQADGIKHMSSKELESNLMIENIKGKGFMMLVRCFK